LPDFFERYQDLISLIALGVMVVVITRSLLTKGVEWLADNAHLTPKLKGKILGFATSIPELVASVSTAAAGLLGASLWNIASSNIINCVLFMSALIWHRQQGRLVQTQFIDEIGFALSAIGLPLMLLLATHTGMERSPWTAVALFGVFLLYLGLDKVLNRHVHQAYAEEIQRVKGNHSVAAALVLIALGILGIALTGYYMGHYASKVVHQLGVPQWAVGWILGFITSLPELTSFFAVFSEAKKRGEQSDASLQANLDNLAASNMANLGLIFPIGIIVYLVVIALA
jgi:cation:H+ antiporter